MLRRLTVGFLILALALLPLRIGAAQALPPVGASEVGIADKADCHCDEGSGGCADQGAALCKNLLACGLACSIMPPALAAATSSPSLIDTRDSRLSAALSRRLVPAATAPPLRPPTLAILA